MKIAFGYKMGVGKDTAVSFLIKKYGGKHISFASPIYDILNYAQERCGFKKEKDRHFLQYIGTEWARKKDKNVWINIAIESANKKNNFISDLRFKNEFTALKNDGWICVKIYRENIDVDRTGSGNGKHSSEIELDSVSDEEWDYVVYNNISLENFLKQIDEIYLKQNTVYNNPLSFLSRKDFRKISIFPFN